MQDEAIFALEINPLLGTALGFVAAVLIGVLAQAIIWWLLGRLTRRFGYAHRLLQETAAPARYAFPLLFIQFLWYTVPDWSWVPLATRFTHVLLVLALTWLTLRVIAAVTAEVVETHSGTGTEDQNARRVQTQAIVIARSLKILVVVVGLGLALMTIPGARTLGTSVLASAGLAGIVAGVAARPVLSNVIAGMQIALSQPFRIDDVLIVQGEWGRVEEITSTYVSLKIWDERRLVIPLQWFIENPFQNWTRAGSQLLGSVYWWVDYRMPLQPLREQLQRICENSREWDGRLTTLQVTDVSDRAVQIRALVSAGNSGDAWDLRCKVRESLIGFMQERYAGYLPRQRNEVDIHERSEEDSAQPA